MFELTFELHHVILHHILKCYAVLDPNAHGQWARPSFRAFNILKELNTAECEGLACKTMCEYGTGVDLE